MDANQVLEYINQIARELGVSGHDPDDNAPNPPSSNEVPTNGVTAETAAGPQTSNPAEQDPRRVELQQKLQRKKQRLEEMRAQRKKEQEEARRLQQQGWGNPRPQAMPLPTQRLSDEEVAQILRDVGIQPHRIERM